MTPTRIGSTARARAHLERLRGKSLPPDLASATATMALANAAIAQADALARIAKLLTPLLTPEPPRIARTVPTKEDGVTPELDGLDVRFTATLAGNLGQWRGIGTIREAAVRDLLDDVRDWLAEANR
jgi:hypothetical protein